MFRYILVEYKVTNYYFDVKNMYNIRLQLAIKLSIWNNVIV